MDSARQTIINRFSLVAIKRIRYGIGNSVVTCLRSNCVGLLQIKNDLHTSGPGDCFDRFFKSCNKGGGFKQNDEGIDQKKTRDIDVAISSPVPAWLDPIKKEVITDVFSQNIVKNIVEGQLLSKWSFKDGLIYFKDHIYLSSTSELTQIIAKEFHSSHHEGYAKTAQRIRAVFFWPRMKNTICEVIKTCQICQINKVSTSSPAGLLSPLPIPEHIWSEISMDFIDGLPNSKGKTSVLVVIDRLSKYAHFIPLAHPYSAATVAQSFFDTIFKLHGLPEKIVCDRDAIFTSEFWKELFRLQGTSFNFSSSYHTQTNGQTEVVNRVLQMYLRCFVGDRPKDWTKWIAWAE